MITVKGGALYQWDTGRVIEILPTTGYKVDEVQVYNGTTEYSKVLGVEVSDNKYYARIPDVFLQSDNGIDVYVVMKNGDAEITVGRINLHVISRKKPEDYIYVEGEELKTWEELRSLIYSVKQEVLDEVNNLISEMKEEILKELKAKL